MPGLGSSDRHAVHAEPADPAGTGRAAVVDELVLHGVAARRQLLGRRHHGALDATEVVDVVHLAALHVEAPAAEAPGLGDHPMSARRFSSS